MSLYNSNQSSTPKIVGVVVVAIVLLLCGRNLMFQETAERVTIKVKRKYETRKGDKYMYRVDTYGGEVFEVCDSMYQMRFNAADIYGRLEKGKCYDIKAIGWRTNFLSEFRDIDSAREVPCKEAGNE